MNTAKFQEYCTSSSPVGSVHNQGFVQSMVEGICGKNKPPVNGVGLRFTGSRFCGGEIMLSKAGGEVMFVGEGLK